jgi:CobQ-like glutamine amidotransferase family enzyme
MLHTERHYIWVMICGTQRLLQHYLKVESDSITGIALIPNMTSCESSDNVYRDFHI